MEASRPDRPRTLAEKLTHLMTWRGQERLGRRYSQEEVASGTGLSRTAVYKLLSGEATNPRRSTLQRLAEFFDVHPGYFFDEPAVAPEPSPMNLQVALRAANIDPAVAAEVLTLLVREMTRPTEQMPEERDR